MRSERTEGAKGETCVVRIAEPRTKGQRVALSTEDVYEPVTHKVGGKRVN